MARSFQVLDGLGLGGIIVDDKLPKSAEVEVMKITGGEASVGYLTSDGVTGAMILS